MKQWLIVIILFVVFGLTVACNSAAIQPSVVQAQTTELTFELQSNDENAVTVDITPLNLPEGGASVDFEVAFNTHSVELDFDPATISLLRDDEGREYPALAWEGSPPNGHHRSGTLRFKVPDYATNFIEVVIKDVAGVPERVFRWDLVTS
jgi:hypothetical protein